MVKRKSFVKTLFLNLQEEMLASLGIIGIDHPTAKGDYTELNWLELFQCYLPKRYKAERAFVIDSNGTISDAIDVVIFDNHYSPFLLNKKGVKYIPSESVYAVFEVKQSLTLENIKYAAKKADSVRCLTRTSTVIDNGGLKQQGKEPFDIIAGLLTTNCSWKKNCEQQLKSGITKCENISLVDLGCCMNYFSFSAIKQNKKLKFEIESYKNQILLTFFFDLLHRLQKIGTVPAIDLTKYVKIPFN